MNSYIIDCSKITSREELHRILAETLSFPEWYGHNLDALYDCLMDISTETEVILQNWKNSERWMSGFACVFEQTSLENPRLMIKLK